MKVRTSIWFVLSLCSLYGAQLDPQEVFPAGLINFNSAGVHAVLFVYADLSGLQLVTSSHVKSVAAGITLQPEAKLTRAEAMKLFEKAFLDQAGIVITKLDGNRVSVTYNDALPIKTAPAGRPVPTIRKQNSAPPK